MRQQRWQGKLHLKNHLYIHVHPSKEVDLERKVKYLPNLMNDISEKKIDHFIHEMLLIKKQFDFLRFSWPLRPWTLTLSARGENYVKHHVSNINIKNRSCFDLLFFHWNPNQVFKPFQSNPLPIMLMLGFGRSGTILHAVEFKFRSNLVLFHATSNTFSSPTWFWPCLCPKSHIKGCII